MLDEIMNGIKSTKHELRFGALKLFVSLSRSDKMIKAIIVEHGDFSKEISKILTTEDLNDDITLVACKSICNFASDN